MNVSGCFSCRRDSTYAPPAPHIASSTNITGSNHGLSGHFSHRPALRYYPRWHVEQRGPVYAGSHWFSPRHANLGSHGFTTGHAVSPSTPPAPPTRPTKAGTAHSGCEPGRSNRHHPGADVTKSSSSSFPGHTAPRSAPSGRSNPPPPYSQGQHDSPSSPVYPAGHVVTNSSNTLSTKAGDVRFAAQMVRFFRPTVVGSSSHATR